MSDAELVTVEVLNGGVVVGDTVAVAVGSGDLPKLRVGKVTALVPGRYGNEVRVRVEQGGPRRWNSAARSYEDGQPYERTFDRPKDRILRLEP
jgi:hypothetical protein